MQIEVVRPGALTASMVDRWSALQRTNAAFDSPFLGPQWVRTVEQAAGASDLRVAVVSRDGEPAGFLPTRAQAFTAMPPGAPLCDYQALVAAPDLEIDARVLVGALGVHRLDFTHMLASQGPFGPHVRGQAESFVIDVTGGYEAYAQARRDAGFTVLKDLDKKRRRVEREARDVQFTAFSRSRRDFDQLIAWKREQMAATRQTDVLGTGWVERVLTALFESRDPDFGGVMFTLHIDGRLAAAHFHLRGRQTIHAWLIAHEAALERHSPGLLLFQSILRWMDDTPYGLLDLGAGDYRFKRELANSARIVSHGFVGRPSPAALLRQAEYGVRSVAERLPLGRVSELPGKAMRRLDIRRALR